MAVVIERWAKNLTFLLFHVSFSLRRYSDDVPRRWIENRGWTFTFQCKNKRINYAKLSVFVPSRLSLSWKYRKKKQKTLGIYSINHRRSWSWSDSLPMINKLRQSYIIINTIFVQDASLWVIFRWTIFHSPYVVTSDIFWNSSKHMDTINATQFVDDIPRYYE